MWSGDENFQVMSCLLVLYQQNMKIQLQMRLESKSAEVDERKLLLSVWGQVYNWCSFLWPAKARRALEMKFWEMGKSCLFLWVMFGWEKVVWLEVFCLFSCFLFFVGFLVPSNGSQALYQQVSPLGGVMEEVSTEIAWKTENKVTETREKRGWMC